jgi:hypothetical protein
LSFVLLKRVMKMRICLASLLTWALLASAPAAVADDLFTDRQTFYDAFDNEIVIGFENEPPGPVVGDPWVAQGVVFDEAGVGDNMIVGDGGGADNNIYAGGGNYADIEITFPSPVVAFGLGVFSNNVQRVDERIIFYGENDIVLLDVQMPLTGFGSSEFVGYHTDVLIFRVAFVENDSDSDYVGIGDVALVPSLPDECEEPPFTICHFPLGSPENARTLTVGSVAALDAHLTLHGDWCGPCEEDGAAPSRTDEPGTAALGAGEELEPGRYE